MSLIQVSDLTFSYDGSYDLIFDEASFQIDTDWKLGFVGRNGRGKTTFLKLLMGQMEYRGTIKADVEFDYFPFSVPNIEEDTIAVAYGIYPELEYWQLVRELSRLEMEEETLSRPFCTLSGGERTKVLLAVLFLKEHNFLLIDEPTNHLDTETRQLVGDYLAKKKGFILVSHDRAFLDRSVDHILAINKTKITVTKGDFSTWYENKQRQDQFELDENQRLRADIRRLKKAARQAKAWADEVESTKIGKKAALKFETTGCIDTRAYVGEKSRRMQQRRKNLEKRQQRAIDEKSGLLKDIEVAEDLKLFPGLNQIKKDSPLVRLRDFGIAYPGKQNPQKLFPVFKNTTFEIMPGEQILLKGRNGCGKSSILKKLMEEYALKKASSSVGPEDRPEEYGETMKGAIVTGELWLDSHLKISYVPQDASFLSGSLKEYARRIEEEDGVEMNLFMTLLRKLDMPRQQFEKRMEEFSEGQKKKVLLAQSLCQQADLYLWDEPLNYIDIYSRMQIEQVIQTARPTMILVEHDERFTQTIAPKEIKVV